MGKARISNAKWDAKRNRWQIQVQRNGERKSFYSSTAGQKGLRECNAKADKWLASGIANESTRVHTLCERWLNEVLSRETNGSTAYHTQCNGIMKRSVLPSIGGKKIGEVTEGDLQRVIDAAAANGYAKKTILNIRGCMAAFFKYCRADKCTAITTDSVNIPKDAKACEKATLQPSDIGRLFASDMTVCGKEVVPSYYVHLFRFYVVTGYRTGEAIARAKNDVSADGYITITSSVNSVGEVTRGKNAGARRVMKLPKIALDILEAQRREERRRGIVSSLLFPSLDGTYIDQQKLRYAWYQYRDFNGLPKVSLYELRHTFISLSLTTMSEEHIKMLVGHSAAMNTAGVYGHEVMGEREKASAEVDALFQSILNDTVPLTI